MIAKRIIHLLSGGLDSVTLMHQLVADGHAVHALSFEYGQKHSIELVRATAATDLVGVKHTLLPLPILGGLTSTTSWIIPNRNMIFASIAANLAIQAGADTVTLGCNADDRDAFPDCREEFRESLNHTLKMSGTAVEVCFPYADKTKAEIASIAQRLGVSREDVWTCYTSSTEACGECPACEKLEAAWL